MNLISGNHQKINPEQLYIMRIIGNPTDYIQTVGDSDNLDRVDRAILSIKHGDINEFTALLPEVSDQYGLLLVHAAGSPGRIGNSMMTKLLECMSAIPAEIYKQACLEAVGIRDLPRVLLLLEKAPSFTENYDFGLNGEVMLESLYSKHEYTPSTHMAEEILKASSEEQIAAIQPDIIRVALSRNNYSFAHKLIKAGVKLGELTGKIMYVMAANGGMWTLKAALEAGADINHNYFCALRTCLYQNNMVAAQILIDHDADYDGFCKHMENYALTDIKQKFISDLGTYHKSKSGEDSR